MPSSAFTIHHLSQQFTKYRKAVNLHFYSSKIKRFAMHFGGITRYNASLLAWFLNIANADAL
jgi:hypothetical protein